MDKGQNLAASKDGGKGHAAVAGQGLGFKVGSRLGFSIAVN
jgi:hypothetical protein